MLPDGAARPIALHVSGCANCKRRLKRLDALVDADEATVAAGNPGPLKSRGGAPRGLASGNGRTDDDADRGDDGEGEGREDGEREGARGQYLEKDARVGRYVIREVIGVGGMGAVYAAHDPELNRRVALKVLRARRSADTHTSEGHSRLMREAQALARLSHPNIVTVYDVGSFEGEIYIAMELVDGTTLTDWMKKAPRSWKDVARVFVLAGRGLAAAHAASLVHRDFKPDNVLVGRDGRVRVMDFGLARPAGGPDGEDSADDDEPSFTDPSVERSFLKGPLTRKGIIVGTPMYMAPEQFLNEPIDARSDQFSFCVALYEALYGHLPFEGDTVEDLAHAIVAARLPALPPSRRVPLAVHRVLRRGMKSEPKDRYPSMDSLLRALEFGINFRTRASALAGVAAAAAVVAVVNPFESAEKLCPDPMSELAGVWDGPRQAATEAAFKKTGARFAKDAFHSVQLALDDYAREWAQAKREACLATRVRREQSEEMLELRSGCLDRRRRELDELVGLFLNADAELLQRSVHAAFALSSVAGCADLAALAAPSGPEQAEVRAKVSEQRAKLAAAAARRHAGKYKEALKIASETTAAARELKFRPLEAEALSLRGRLEEETGDFKAAEQTLLDATTAAQAARLHSLAARALVDLTLVVGHRQGRTEEARHFGQLASGLIEGLGSPDELNADQMETMGLVLWRAGDYAAASSYARRVLELREKVHGPGSLEVAKALKQLGVAYNSLSRLEEALACLERAIPIQEKLLGADHPEVALTLNNLGFTLASMSRFAEADVAFGRSLAIYEAAFGATSPTLGPMLNNIGSSLITQGRYGEALKHLNRALDITEKAMGRENPRIPPMLNNIADALLKQGKPAEALIRYEQALVVREKTLGKNHVNMANELTGIGLTYLSLGKPEQALPPLERALKLREQSPGYPGKLAETRYALARALWGTSRDRERAVLLATSAMEGVAADDPMRAEIAQWLQRRERR
jgi:serine/threonine protein kinase/Tfp pilus assembly protein PilF